jgi:hypothetical protein
MAKVDWKILKHAQGPAARVPTQIKDLLKPGHPSDAAASNLARDLLVPGRWLETSAPAAELLVAQVMKKGATPVPLELRLLGDLAAADHLWFATRGAPDARANDTAGSETLAIAEKALPLARAWLGDADGARRAIAGFFLALVERDGTSVDAVAGLARTDPLGEVRGGAAFALGFFARAGHVAARAALDALTGDGFTVAGRWAGLVVAGAEPTADATVDGCVAWFARWEPTLLPWGRAQPLRVATALTRALPPSDALAPSLARGAAMLGPARPETRLVCGVAADLAGFTTSFKEREVAPASALSAVQRATAEALIAAPGPLLGMRHGLPGSSRAAARWIGLAPAGVLERVGADGLARWQRVRALFGQPPPAGSVVIAEALKGLSPVEQLEAARELLLGAYKILIDVDARFPPSALAELVRAAGKDAAAWARESMEIAVTFHEGGHASAQMSPEHMMVVLAALVDAGIPIEPAWEPFVGLAPVPEARKVLGALAPARRSEIALGRLARGAASPAGHAQLLDALAPVLDLIPGPEVHRRARDLLAEPNIAKFVDPANVKLILANPLS